MGGAGDGGEVEYRRLWRDGRLVCYREKRPDRDLWDALWAGRDWRDFYRPYEGGELGEYERVFMELLPRGAPVLEAGCGMGQLVLALRRRGFDCWGLDSASQTLREVRRVLPELPLMEGDVRGLPLADASLGGYISLGVVEHLPEGPEPILREARRVLRPGGVALISVPFFSPLRRIKAALGRYEGPEPDMVFFQYAFGRGEFSRILRDCGLRPLRAFGQDLRYGLYQEWPGLEAWLEGHRGGWRLKQWIERSAGWRLLLGHMLMLYCRRED